MGNPTQSHWDTAHFSAGWRLSPEGSHRFVRRQKHSIHHESDVENTNLLSVSKGPDLNDTHVWTIGYWWLIVQTLSMGNSDILKRSQRYFIHKLAALACGAQYYQMEKEVVIWWITTKLFLKITDIAVTVKLITVSIVQLVHTVQNYRITESTSTMSMDRKYFLKYFQIFIFVRLSLEHCIHQLSSRSRTIQFTGQFQFQYSLCAGERRH